MIIKVIIVLVCFGIVLCGFVREITKIRKRNTCPHINKQLVLTNHADRYEQYHCDDCGNDVYFDIEDDV